MTKYVALLRGIGPSNPNMHQSKLKAAFEKLGFTDVSPLLSSGNVVFTSPLTDMPKLESMIEQGLEQQLGFSRDAIVRSQQQLQTLVDAEPYGQLKHNRETYLLATFFKHPTKIGFTLPLTLPDKGYNLLAEVDNTLFSVTDTTALKTPDLMAWLEKQYGKQITSRTWLTVQRILKKMG